MGRHSRRAKNKPKKYNENKAESLFNFFDASLSALISIFNNTPNGKVKKHYRVYKVK
jgi:hypothetical protein